MTGHTVVRQVVSLNRHHRPGLGMTLAFPPKTLKKTDLSKRWFQGWGKRTWKLIALGATGLHMGEGRVEERKGPEVVF
jgi:hypothetical protein